MTNFIKFACALSLFASNAFAEDSCTYSDWRWDTTIGQAVDFETVRTTKEKLSDEQRHAELNCTICSEDMITLKIADLEPFDVCHVIAPAIEEALYRALDEGFPIATITAYRVGRSKGPLDAQGRRTEYSHHSFGLAIDINAEANGLYGNCFEFGPDCRLRRGGHWDPENPASITPETPIYQAFRDIGFQWGGELYGRQKDFMHFSLSGD